MKISKVAKMIGVDRGTILNWIGHEYFQKFFSEDSRAKGNRVLSEQDLLILNTINHLRKSETKDWDEIAERLDGGYVVTDLSIGAADVDTGKTPLAQFAKTMEISQERDLAMKQLAEVQQRILLIEDLHREELDKVRQEHRAELKEEMREAAERENKLHNKIGQLEAELKFSKGKTSKSQSLPNNDDKDDG